MIIGLDVGGTHTDVVLLNKQGIVRDLKVPTEASDLFQTVLKGLSSITKDVEPESIQRIVLSTTLTTNAIVQNKVPPVGVIVTGGPGLDPAYFQTNEHYYPASGSIDHRGREIDPIDPDEIKVIGQHFLAQDIHHLGVIGKFSTRNPIHEIQIKEQLGHIFEKVFLGHRMSGHLNFPRRIATTYLNAAVYPIHKTFFEAVHQSLKTKGLNLPIRILKADGGNMRFESSIDIPGQTILSGPAASVMGAVAFAPADKETLVLDIGGTTTDMAVLIDGVPLLAPLGIKLGGMKTLIRSLDTYSIGIGGDSHVRLKGNVIEVGPERVGAAMAYGGPVPTPTDALFVLGRMQNGDRQKAARGIQSLATGLEVSLETAAEKIVAQACRKILNEARSMVDRLNQKPVYTIHEIQEGYRLDPKDIMILGGPAPFFAPEIEKQSGFNVQVVPKWSIVNAIGAALARTTCEVSLFADTEQGSAIASGENYRAQIQRDFSRDEALETVYGLLKEKAIRRGADPEHLEMEILEENQFNMIRGFSTTGKNIRVRAQVKPGLIHGYESIIRSL